MSGITAEISAQNAAVLANAIEFGQQIVQGVLGDDVSNHIAGQELRSKEVADLIAANFQKQLAPYIGV